MASYSSHRAPYATHYGTAGDEKPEEERKESKKEIKARLILEGISLGSTQIMMSSKVQALYSHVTEAVIQPSQADGFVFSRGTSQDKSEAMYSVDNNKVT